MEIYWNILKGRATANLADISMNVYHLGSRGFEAQVHKTGKVSTRICGTKFEAMRWAEGEAKSMYFEQPLSEADIAKPSFWAQVREFLVFWRPRKEVL